MKSSPIPALALTLAVTGTILGTGWAEAQDRGRGSITLTNKRSGESRRIIVEQSQREGAHHPGAVLDGRYTRQQVEEFNRVFGHLPPGITLDALVFRQPVPLPPPEPGR